MPRGMPSFPGFLCLSEVPPKRLSQSGPKIGVRKKWEKGGEKRERRKGTEKEGHVGGRGWVTAGLSGMQQCSLGRGECQGTWWKLSWTRTGALRV